ncbi:MAG: glutamate 5-kinase [Oscillospiraceae bacterium]|nr:glutamate 5-kinase [Oscillospiraceae bacterium]
MLKNAKRIVVKVGTSTLTYPTGKINIRRVKALVEVLSDLRNAGIQLALVTSGAIGIGAVKLGLPGRPQDTPGRQAAATVGQCELMFLYDKLFSEYGQVVGQLLITRSDIENGERRENLINCFEKLFDYGAMPVINENDSVAVEEIVYGDNDNLSAQVAKLIGADGLIILSDIDGLFSANPSEDESAVLIPIVREIDESVYCIAGGSSSSVGTGGMATKITAAKIATDAGIETVVMNGANPEDIYRAIDGRQVGTQFLARN